jgi:hypothetical protein
MDLVTSGGEGIFALVTKMVTIDVFEFTAAYKSVTTIL